MNPDFLKKITVTGEKTVSSPEAGKPAEPVIPSEPVKPAEPVTPSEPVKPAEAKPSVEIPTGEEETPVIETEEVPTGGEPEEIKPRRGRPPKNGKKTFQEMGMDAQKLVEVNANLSFDMTISTLRMLFGDEWNPRTPQEREMVVDAIKRYYAEKGMMDIPPGWMLVIIISTYSLPRLAHPNTGGKLKRIFWWIKGKFMGLFRKAAEKINVA
jgi:hypothetical protein